MTYVLPVSLPSEKIDAAIMINTTTINTTSFSEYTLKKDH